MLKFRKHLSTFSDFIDKILIKLRSDLFITSGFTIAICIFLFANYTLFNESKNLISANKKIFYSFQIIINLQENFSLVQDAQLNQKQYILTGHEYYLSSFKNSVAEINSSISRLEESISPNKEHLILLSVWKRLIYNKLDEMQSAISLSKTSTRKRALEEFKANEKNDTMNNIRKVIAEVKKQENTQRLKLEIDEEKYKKLTQSLYIIVSIINTLFLLFIFHLVKKEVSSQKKLSKEITELNKLLEITVEHQHLLLRVDYLTGAINKRHLTKLVKNQIELSKNSPYQFTFCYIDCDNFKVVNDTLGHNIGDELLKKIAIKARKFTSERNIFSRIGGDEFALLLQNTDFETSQRIIFDLRDDLLEEMKNNNWPVSFSIGAVTFKNTPKSSDQIFKLADSLMYKVKKKNKNDIIHEEY
jgi:diguanylate cyclase (GGDEF)-like protein